MNNLFQMFVAVRNPQQFLQNVMGNNQIMQNPMMKNAISMYQNGNTEGLKNMAENICREKGINPDEAYKRIKSQFGM